jgi:DNA adenine methylase
MSGGIIGGKDQTGPWKLDARYNRNELARRIERVSRSQAGLF